MKKNSFLFLAITILVSQTFAQKKSVTIDNIWATYSFYAKRIGGIRSLNDGIFYTSLERTKSGSDLVKYSYKDEKYRDVILKNEELKFGDKPISLDDYEFNNTETKLLIASDDESIYRHSSKADYFIYDISTKQINKLSEGEKQMYATFSPNSTEVAFVKENNLYYKELNSNNEIQITTDGKKGSIINGASDWVYEEELVLVSAFDWSPDGTKIAYYKFDESKVKEWHMELYNDLYPEQVKFKYPKAGEENSKVEIYVYDLQTKTNQKLNVPISYEYISRINWSNDSKNVAIQTFNRLQNYLAVHLINVDNNQAQLIYEEKDERYVEIPTTIFLATKNQFIITSEKDGYNHVYLYDLSGKLINQVTKGLWEVNEIYGVDEKTGTMYYQSTEESPITRNIYSIKLNGKDKKKLNTKNGVNNAEFSSTFNYFINTWSNAKTPYLTTINDNKGKEVRLLEDNQPIVKRMAEYSITNKEFFKVKINGQELNAWSIKPVDFDSTKKYPLFMFVYGGDGNQTVMDEYDSFNDFWYQHLASKGYIVISVDNRGTEGRGAEFRKSIYKQLGKYETEDQIEVAKYFSTLPYIDGSRIGIFGWSFGGYLSTSCLLKGADVFKTAIAVAPVTNWRYYDNIYTERYMQTPQENAQGYDDNSPINHVEKLKGNYLLIHGMADDNVHYQNTAEMINALIKANKQFTQFSYPNKNHGISGGNTRLHLYNLMTNFIINNL
ncbi:MAG: DPP IV N-terminal domain-containing protein [Bacteroidetes bacterium]|nr:DPP IV N-terminal domain-containing protein [Bacteroidota bacterium]